MKMSNTLYIIAVIVCTAACTFLTPWWMLPTLIFILTLFYKGAASSAVLIAGSISALMWSGIAGYRDYIAVEKASSLVGKILGDISPILVIIISGLIIGIACSLAAISGKLISQYLPDRFNEKLN